MNSSTEDPGENKAKRLWEELSRWKELKRKGSILVKVEAGKIVYLEAQLPIK